MIKYVVAVRRATWFRKPLKLGSASKCISVVPKKFTDVTIRYEAGFSEITVLCWRWQIYSFAMQLWGLCFDQREQPCEAKAELCFNVSRCSLVYWRSQTGNYAFERTGGCCATPQRTDKNPLPLGWITKMLLKSRKKATCWQAGRQHWICRPQSTAETFKRDVTQHLCGRLWSVFNSQSIL